MFRILDRYVLREVLPPLVICLLVLTFLLVIPPIAQVAERLIAKGVPFLTVGRILVTLIPQALGITIPMALLIGLLIGLARLSSDRETVALQASGVSLYRLLRPVGILTLVCTAVTMWLLIRAVPDANQTFRDITYGIVATRAEGEVRPRVFFEDFPSMVLYVRDTPAGGGWTDVFLADTRDATRPDIYLADSGRMLLDRENRRVELLLEHGVRHRHAGPDPGTYEVFRFDRMVLSMDPDAVFPRTGLQRGDRERSIRELRERVQELEAAGESPHAPIMEIHKKFSIPAACIVFALMALPLGVSTRRDGKLASFLIGTGVIFGYYVVMYLGEALAKGHLVSAHLAMWLPNLLVGGFALLFLVRRAGSADRLIPVPAVLRRRHREPQRIEVSPPPGAGSSLPPRRPVVVIRVPRFGFPRPTLLDAYVMTRYLGVFATAFVGLLGVFYISTFIDLSDKLFKGETTGGELLAYFWYATPQFIYFVIPIAALLATLVTIGLLTRTSELVVMKACGISLYRAAGPLFLFGALWSGALFALEESLLPQANRRAEAIRHVIRGGSPQTFDVLNRKWIVSRDGRLYHYAYYDPRREELNGFSIYGIDEHWRMQNRLFASRVAFADGTWLAHGGWLRQFGAGGDPLEYETFDQQPLDMESPDYFVTEQPDAERMSWRQLRGYIDELQLSGFDVVPYSVALHRKISFPFVTVIMTLIGVPFAVTTGRRGALYGIGLGIALALAYWIVISMFAAIGSGGLLAPVLAAWAPNVLFATGAAYLLLTVRT